MRHSLLLLLLLLLQSPSWLISAAEHKVLKPFDYITGELVDLDIGVKRYLLAELKPSTSYEVRVSFPASIPAAIKYQIVDATEAAETAATRKPARRLLDCEKLIFSTDSKAAVQGITSPGVLLTATRRSVHRDGPTAGASKLVYNIVLAELLPVVGLPFDSIPTVVAVVLVVLAALLWSLCWASHLYPKLLTWLAAPDTAAAGHTKRSS